MIRSYVTFLGRAFKLSFAGGRLYYCWMFALTVLAVIGARAFCQQTVAGLTVTGMTDQISWGVYIANFTFLVGIAAAAVMLVIPAYIYRQKEIHDVVLFGELLAIAAIVMCLCFVTVDLGRPDRFWHLMPFVGKMNFPRSMLAWDVIVLSGYLLVNLHICGYLLYM
ncbi:MAG: polysulfide reductase NrfD, partial [Candidatus Hydrogenedentes bacterium]|nr:polysulfide reductase NrfD [Candidatus Hydrogenedentota bacterium]